MTGSFCEIKIKIKNNTFIDCLWFGFDNKFSKLFTPRNSGKFEQTQLVCTKKYFSDKKRNGWIR